MHINIDIEHEVVRESNNCPEKYGNKIKRKKKKENNELNNESVNINLKMNKLHFNVDSIHKIVKYLMVFILLF